MTPKPQAINVWPQRCQHMCTKPSALSFVCWCINMLYCV